MPEEVKSDNEDAKSEKKKGALGKLKEKLIPDSSEQAAIISTMVRLGVLIWSGGILTLNYVTVPGIPQQKIDPTFIASVFTGVLASFGIQTASKKGDGTMKMDAAAKAAASGCVTVHTIRVEQMPLKIIAADIPPKSSKPTEPPVEPTV